jgi:hypothetical protein
MFIKCFHSALTQSVVGVSLDVDSAQVEYRSVLTSQREVRLHVNQVSIPATSANRMSRRGVTRISSKKNLRLCIRGTGEFFMEKNPRLNIA